MHTRPHPACTGARDAAPWDGASFAPLMMTLENTKLAVGASKKTMGEESYVRVEGAARAWGSMGRSQFHTMLEIVTDVSGWFQPPGAEEGGAGLTLSSRMLEGTSCVT